MHVDGGVGVHGCRGDTGLRRRHSRQAQQAGARETRRIALPRFDAGRVQHAAQSVGRRRRRIGRGARRFRPIWLDVVLHHAAVKTVLIGIGRTVQGQAVGAPVLELLQLQLIVSQFARHQHQRQVATDTGANLNAGPDAPTDAAARPSHEDAFSAPLATALPAVFSPFITDVPACVANPPNRPQAFAANSPSRITAALEDARKFPARARPEPMDFLALLMAGPQASFNRVHCFPRSSVSPEARDNDDSRLDSSPITAPPPRSNKAPWPAAPATRIRLSPRPASETWKSAAPTRTGSRWRNCRLRPGACPASCRFPSTRCRRFCRKGCLSAMVRNACANTLSICSPTSRTDAMTWGRRRRPRPGCLPDSRMTHQPAPRTPDCAAPPSGRFQAQLLAVLAACVSPSVCSAGSTRAPPRRCCAGCPRRHA